MGKRGNNEGSIYQRKDGRWVGTVSLGWVNGKLKRKSFYGKKRSDVATKRSRAIEDNRNGLPILPEHLTVADVLTQWLETTGKNKLRASPTRAIARR